MERGILDEEYISPEECIDYFNREGMEFKRSRLENGGLRRTFYFERNHNSFAFYLSIQKKHHIFLGIGSIKDENYSNEAYDDLRYRMSRAVHVIVKELEARDCTKLLQLMLDEWYELGASVIPNIERYPFLLNPQNYKAIKKEVRQALETIPYDNLERGETVIYLNGTESLQVARAIESLGYASFVTPFGTAREVEVKLKEEFKNKVQICQRLRQMGYSAH